MNKAVLCLRTFWTRQCTIPQTCRVFSVSSPLPSLSHSLRRPLPRPPMSVCWNPTLPEVWLKCHLSHRLPSTPLPTNAQDLLFDPTPLAHGFSLFQPCHSLHAPLTILKSWGNLGGWGWEQYLPCLSDSINIPVRVKRNSSLMKWSQTKSQNNPRYSQRISDTWILFPHLHLMENIK